MKILIQLFFLIPIVVAFKDNEVIGKVGLKAIEKFSGIDHEGVEFEKTYYITQYLTTTPINARSACKSYSSAMDLASFESREEFLKIRPKLSAEIRDKPVIVGGFLHGNEYRWMSSGLKIDFRYDPSKGKNCLGLQKEGAIGYVPLTCNEEYLFICQKIEFHYSN